MAIPSPPSATASSGLSQPPQYRAIGVILAISSGVLIGSSFVFKKKGLLSSQKGHAAGEGVAYLKSPMWWTGMIIMILGELCNFAAYAFTEAIIVTPMGALSVVISSLLSHFLLNEKLSLFGWIASVQCLLGSSILALNGPEEQSVDTIVDFRKLFVTPWFLSYAGIVVAVAIFLAVWVAPRYGRKNMLPYISICSLIGGISVSCTQALGACILTSIRGQNQFKNWFIYFLLILVIVTLLTEIYYLNVALALYNTAMVTPTYYVTFTFCTLVTSVILFKGLKTSASQLITVILAFVVICTGIFILQMSKVDPRKLAKVDEHTTLLLEAARQEADPGVARRLSRNATLRSRRLRHSVTRTRTSSGQSHPSTAGASDLPRSDREPEVDLADDLDFASDTDPEENAREIVEKTEEPGIDSLRGTFGAIGTIIRAKRRARALSAASSAGRPSRFSQQSHSHHSHHTQEGTRKDSGSARPTWLDGRWSSVKDSRFQAVQEADVEKGDGYVFDGRGRKAHEDEISAANTTLPGSYSSFDLSYSGPLSSPSSIPLHALRSQSTLRSGDSTISGETSKPMIHIPEPEENSRKPKKQ